MAAATFRKALLKAGVPDFTCRAGTMVHKTYETSPAIRGACNRSNSGHASGWNRKSTRRCGVGTCHPSGQGEGAAAEIAADSIDHLTRYVAVLLLPDR